MKIEFAKLDEQAEIPKYGRAGDAGADITCVNYEYLLAGQRKAISTGLAIALPEGYAAFVHPRSGLALNKGISVVNAPGTIDSGYRGEIKVILINHSDETVTFEPGDRIAQLVIQKYEHVTFEEVNSLSETERGIGGFGSTGLASV